MYCRLVFWPSPLLIHYELPYLDSMGAAWPWLLALIALALAVVVLYLRRMAVGFVGVCVFLILSPTLVVPILSEVAAERRMYLPLAAFVPLVVVTGFYLAQWLGGRLARASDHDASVRFPIWLTVGCVVALGIVYGISDRRRLSTYDDEQTIWTDNLRRQPNDSLAHNNLGLVLLRTHRPQEALKEFEQAIQLVPGNIEANTNLGMTLIELDRPQEAISSLQKSLELKPRYAYAHYNLGNAYYHTGRLELALEQYQRQF